MKPKIIERSEWPSSPVGNYFTLLEQNWYDATVDKAFGFHALQLGAPWLQTLSHSRVRRHWLLDEPLAPANNTDKESKADTVLTANAHSHLPTQANEPAPKQKNTGDNNTNVHLQACFDALPIEERSIDVLTCPHTLEICHNPHQAVREMHRILVPEGKLFLTAFNPNSLWGLAQRRNLLYARWGLSTPLLPTPNCGKLSLRRLRDWLRLLGFEIESTSFFAYRPTFRSAAALQRSAFYETLGTHYWPFWGAVYAIEAVKRQHTAHPSRLRWIKKPVKKPFVRPVAIPHHTSQKNHETS